MVACAGPAAQIVGTFYGRAKPGRTLDLRKTLLFLFATIGFLGFCTNLYNAHISGRLYRRTAGPIVLWDRANLHPLHSTGTCYNASMRSRDGKYELKDVPRCGAKRRTDGGPCLQKAGAGTDHPGVGRCSHHCGNTANHSLSGLIKEMDTMVMGPAIEVDPHEALLTLVSIAAGEVGYLTRRIAALNDAQLMGPLPSSTTRDGNGPGGYVSMVEITEGPPTLNLLVRARHVSMDKLARYSKMAVDAGVEERQVRMVERQADLVYHYFEAVLNDLNLTASQRQDLGSSMRRHMPLIEAGEAVTA